VLLIFKALENDIVRHRIIDLVPLHAGSELILVKELNECFNVDFAGVERIHEFEDGFYVLGRDPPEFAIGFEAPFEMFKSEVARSYLMEGVVILQSGLNLIYLHVALCQE